MSLARATLVTIQAFCNQLACTPPNPSPSKDRYHTDELYILQIAPLIFKVHQMVLWACAIFETLFYIGTLYPMVFPQPFASSPACLTSHPNVRFTPIFVIGVVAVVLGTYIRMHCFRTLGPFFTFDLTVHPEHKLVTNGLYAYVRHPAYNGSILLVAGIALSHLTEGSWLLECGPLRVPGSAIVVWASWWIWTLAVGVSRAEAEDKQMQKLFHEEWDTYAAHVTCWFLPGLI